MLTERLTPPSEATEKLLRQFQERGHTFEVIEAELGSTANAAAAITEIVASTFTSDIPSNLQPNTARHTQFYISQAGTETSDKNAQMSMLRYVNLPIQTRAKQK